MKQIVLILTITFLAMTAIPVLAYDEVLPPDPTATGRFTSEPAGEFLIFDAVILRPLGIASMAVGMASATFTYPWSIPSGTQDRVSRELIEKPFWYTFCRPIGDLDF